MGALSKILTLLCLFLFVNFSYATGGLNGKTQDNSENSQQGDKKKSKDSNALSIENLDDPEMMELENVDSLGDDSVSKYNFIFYFLYKFKYSEEETSKALF